MIAEIRHFIAENMHREHRNTELFRFNASESTVSIP